MRSHGLAGCALSLVLVSCVGGLATPTVTRDVGDSAHALRSPLPVSTPFGGCSDTQTYDIRPGQTIYVYVKADNAPNGEKYRVEHLPDGVRAEFYPPLTRKPKPHASMHLIADHDPSHGRYMISVGYVTPDDRFVRLCRPALIVNGPSSPTPSPSPSPTSSGSALTYQGSGGTGSGTFAGTITVPSAPPVTCTGSEDITIQKLSLTISGSSVTNSTLVIGASATGQCAGYGGAGIGSGAVPFLSGTVTNGQVSASWKSSVKVQYCGTIKDQVTVTGPLSNGSIDSTVTFTISPIVCSDGSGSSETFTFKPIRIVQNLRD